MAVQDMIGYEHMAGQDSDRLATDVIKLVHKKIFRISIYDLKKNREEP
jgi:hypothetical protein